MQPYVQRKESELRRIRDGLFCFGAGKLKRRCPEGNEMHYFKRNIGDYAKKAGRLSMLEHGAYTLLLDSCYDREQFPTEQEAIDWCWARTDAEIAAVKFVLSKFFILEDGRYVQNRVREELDAYHAKSEKNSEIAKEREQKRKEASRNVHEACSSGNESPPNHKPITNNQVINISKKPRKERETQIPPDFCVTQELRKWAEGKGIMNIDAHLDPFIMACKAKGYAYVDWSCAFQKAVRDDWAKIGHGKQQQRRFVPA